MDAGQVDLLLILGGNPAYTAPADLRFGERLKAFTDQLRPDGYPGWSVHLGEYFDETSLRCQWHLPEAHFLESWGDVRAYDGTASIVQPLISPLYQGRTASEVLASVFDRLTTTAGRTTGAAATQPASAEGQPTGANGPTTRPGEAVVANTGYEVLRAFWRKQVGDKNFEQWWQKTLARGVIEGTAYKSEPPSAQADLAALLNAPATRPAATTNPAATQPGGSIRVVFRPDPSVWDGRFSNNAWLQELPKPLTKLVWDNAVILSPNTARALGFAEELPANLTKTGDSDELHKVNGRLVSLTVGDRHLNGAPVWILPGHPDNVATLYFGYGRERLGRVANGMGFNAYALRTSANLWTAPNAEIKVQPGRYCAGDHPVQPGDRHRDQRKPGTGAARHVRRRDLRARRAATADCRAAGRAEGVPGTEEPRQPGQPARHPGSRYANGARHGYGPRPSPVALPRCARPGDAGRLAQPELPRLGDGDRPDGVHRVQRVRRRLPVGEQHPRRRQGPGARPAQHALDPDRHLLRDRGIRPRLDQRPRDALPAGAVHALREGPVRGGLPGRGDLAQRRGAQRDDLQPVRRHPVLQQQLPLQGPAVQLPPVLRHRDAGAQADAQPRRVRCATAA